MANAPDVIHPQCQGPDCYRYKPLTYTKARQHLFGRIHLEGDSANTYSLIDSYCQVRYTNNDFSPTSPLAPLKIPDTKVVNTEHVWPQSKFSKQFAENDQKSNMHILLPVNSRVNSTRSNHPMGWVVKPTSSPCADAALGKNQFNQTVFEPSDVTKGCGARLVLFLGALSPGHRPPSRGCASRVA